MIRFGKFVFLDAATEAFTARGGSQRGVEDGVHVVRMASLGWELAGLAALSALSALSAEIYIPSC